MSINVNIVLNFSFNRINHLKKIKYTEIEEKLIFITAILNI